MNQSVLLFENNIDVIDFNRRPVDGINCTQTSMFREDLQPLLLKCFRRLFKFTTILTLGAWYKDGKHYDCAIIPDVFFNLNILKILTDRKKADRQILYYRNRIRQCDLENIEFAKKNGFILASYSLEDSNDYQMNFVPQYWNKKIISGKSTIVNNDVYFLGAVKNRYKQLIEIKNECELHGLLTKFQIVSKKPLPYTMKNSVKYTEVVSNILSSKAIVDVVADDNWGLTLRPLEALMSRKKLITNYTDIKKYDFYVSNADNIFIIGEDCWDKLNEFVNCPFTDCDTTLDHYDSECWLKKIASLQN